MVESDTLYKTLSTRPDPIVSGPEPSSDKSFEWVKGNEDLTEMEEGVPIIDFPKELKARNLEMEFRLLRRLTESQFHNDKLENFNPKLNKMNRYNNIIPYTHSKVIIGKILQSDTDETDEYLNANYISTSFNDQKVFIATQGPSPATFKNFWKMVWIDKVELIIMLCNLRENGKTQCDQYWPETKGVSMEFPELLEEKEMRITREDSQNLSNLIERKFKIEKFNGKNWEARYVTQVQCTSWPDHGIPQESDYAAIQSLLDRMITIYISICAKNLNNKMVIHCSAGVGRTGTLIAIFNLMLILKKHYFTFQKIRGDSDAEEKIKTFKISVFGTVRRLREQRWGMVHTSEQYVYVNKFIAKMIEDMYLKLG